MSGYPVTMVRTDRNTFVLRIPALTLVVERPTLDEAWTALEAEKADIIERHRRVGAEADLPKPDSPASPADPRLRRFALRAAIVTAAASIVVAAAALSFAYAVREPLRKVGLKLGRAAIAQVESGLREAAQTDLTLEKQEALRRMVADAAPALKPYARELRPLLAEACGNTADRP